MNTMSKIAITACLAISAGATNAGINVTADLSSLSFSYESAYLGGASFGNQSPDFPGESWAGSLTDRVIGDDMLMSWNTTMDRTITSTGISGLNESFSDLDISLGLGGQFVGTSLEAQSRTWINFNVDSDTQAVFNGDHYNAETSFAGSATMLYEFGTVGGGRDNPGEVLFQIEIDLGSPEFQAGAFGSDFIDLEAGVEYYMKVVTTAGVSVETADLTPFPEMGMARAFYDFHIVPAPSTGVMMLGGLGLMGRRRRA